jgi:hypothetical protein
MGRGQAGRGSNSASWDVAAARSLADSYVETATIEAVAVVKHAAAYKVNNTIHYQHLILSSQ